MAGNPATVPILERDVLHRMQSTVGGQFLITVIISRLPPPSDGPVIVPTVPGGATATAAAAASTDVESRPQHQLMLPDDAGTASGMKRKRQTRHCRRCGVQGCPGGYKRTNCPLYVPGEEPTTTVAPTSAISPALQATAIAQAVMAGEGASMTTTPQPTEKKQRKPRTCRICGRQKCPGNSNRKLCENKPAGWTEAAAAAASTPSVAATEGITTATGTTGNGNSAAESASVMASSIVQEQHEKDPPPSSDQESEAGDGDGNSDDDGGEKKPAADSSGNEEADV